MPKDLVKDNQIVKPFIVSAAIFFLAGSFIGSIWFALVLNANIPMVNGSVFGLHRVFLVESGLTILIMGIGFMIVPRFRNIPIGSHAIIVISFLSVVVSTFLVIVSTIGAYELSSNENILFISKILRVFGILLFVGKMIDTLKIKPRLLRTADYFVGLSSICLLTLSVLSLLNLNDNTLTDIELQLLFPVIMIFGIEYKTLPSFMGFVRPRKKLGMLSLLLLAATFVLGLATKLGISDSVASQLLFNLFLLSSSITFGISVYVYNNYENKKYILKSAKDKKERFLYTLHHTRVSFCFLYVGIVMGLMFYVFDEKFMFYDLSIHYVAIGFIGITIASYLPMMLAPILGKPIAVNRFYKVPLILIIISLLTRTVGVVYISYFNGNGFTLLHALTSTSGFLIVLAIVIFVALVYKSIKTNV
jgi:hypothetical protein